MKEKLERAYFRCRLECIKAWNHFMYEEKGASDMVAILLVIVILVAVAAVFKDQLIGAVNTAFKTLNKALEG